mgnify:CR=1 FL=1
MEISKLLLKWYEKQGRELPWRETFDPYKIWVSEIILQQTRIQQGVEYYHSFLKSFPDVFTLAGSDISEVLNIWQGLGYYSRARNMHEAARVIVHQYNGTFPSNYKDLKKLKGIGEYTAGAIASIAFGEQVPAVDGNVKRVFSRLFGLQDDLDRPIPMQNLKNLLQKEIDKNEPGKFNQAVMDLGSLICKPKNPLCSECPLSENCTALKNETVNELPVKYKKIKSRKRYFYYCIISCNEQVLISRRKKKDIWELLYEFPLFESSKPLSDKSIYDNVNGMFLTGQKRTVISDISSEIIHILSHQKLHTRFIHVEVEKLNTPVLSDFTPVKKEKINDFPLPRLIDRYLKETKI